MDILNFQNKLASTSVNGEWISNFDKVMSLDYRCYRMHSFWLGKEHEGTFYEACTKDYRFLRAFAL